MYIDKIIVIVVHILRVYGHIQSFIQFGKNMLLRRTKGVDNHDTGGPRDVSTTVTLFPTFAFGNKSRVEEITNCSVEKYDIE